MDTVTNWISQEFGNKNSVPFFQSIVQHSLKKEKLPLNFIALLDNKPVGTVSLWRSDLVSRQDLYPWLSALYVHPDYRGKRIGQKLQAFLADYCKDQGFTELFLYTSICGYYEKTSWKHIDDGVEFLGDYMKIYKKDL